MPVLLGKDVLVLAAVQLCLFSPLSKAGFLMVGNDRLVRRCLQKNQQWGLGRSALATSPGVPSARGRHREQCGLGLSWGI